MSFKLEWENGIDSQYQTIYRANDPFEFDQLPSIYAMVEKGVSEFTDTAVEDFTPYYYRVASNREENGVIETVASQLVSAGYKGGPSLDLDFACEKYSIMRPNGSMIDRTFSEIITFTRSSPGGVTNEFGQYVQRANNVPRLDHDPASLTTSSSTASYQSSVASFVLPEGHAFFVGDLFRATAVGGSIWGIVTARSATSVTIYVRNSTGTGEASSWTCIRPLGIIIEEQRTNLAARSSDLAAWNVNGSATVSLNDQLSPDGTLNADTLNTSTLGFSGINRTAGLNTQVGSVTWSIFLRHLSGGQTIRLGSDTIAAFGTGTAGMATYNYATGTFSNVGSAVTRTNVTIYPNGWRRIAVTATAVAANSAVILYNGASVAASWAVWGLQIEQAAFESSYIPTEASQVTRAADVCSVNTLSPWFNAAASTWVVDFQGVGFGLHAASGASSRYLIERTSSGAGRMFLVNGPQIDISATPPSASTRVAVSLTQSDFKISAGGSPPATSASVASPPTPTIIGIGGRPSQFGLSAQSLNGTIYRLTYYPRVIDVQQASA